MSLFKRRITEPVVEQVQSKPAREVARIIEIEYGDGAVQYLVETRTGLTNWMINSRYATMDEAVKAKRDLEGEILARTVSARRVVG